MYTRKHKEVVRQDDTGINQNERKTKVTGLENKLIIGYRGYTRF